MANINPKLATRQNYQDQTWGNLKSYRTVSGGRIVADQFSLRAMLFAIPMAAAMWMAGALVGYACL